jgi:two-component system chemotaxis response regulator CheB
MGDAVASKRIRLLAVDDSPSFRAALCLALARDPAIEVVGQASDGAEALELARKVQPDVVTMDVMMPRMDGLEASRRLLASERPVPIILMSTLARSEEQRMALNALRLGVVDVTNKPVLMGAGSVDGAATVIRLVKAASQVILPGAARMRRTAPVAAGPDLDLTLIAIAASTGGPPALERVLSFLPARFPPVVVAQHLAPSFARGFADWLGAALQRKVVSVEERAPLRADTLYLAGEGHHILVERGFVLPRPSAKKELSPSADLLFESAAPFRSSALGVLLTGMGDDGAVGLKAMRHAGAWTIAQDAESSVVYGMPRAAVENGASSEQLPLDEIGPRIAALLTGEPAREAR